MDWIPILAALVGSIGGGYLGVKLSVSVLQTEMKAVQMEIISLRADRHRHANLIQDHEARISGIERKHR